MFMQGCVEAVSAPLGYWGTGHFQGHAEQWEREEAMNKNIQDISPDQQMIRKVVMGAKPGRSH